MHRTPNRLRTGPGRLGEHNEAIYRELLGYSESDYAELVEQGVATSIFPASVWQPEK